MNRLYQNPVWPGYFADPFVLRWRGEYFAYGTAASLERGADETLRAFQILRSPDLVSWKPAGAALPVPEPQAAHAFWAPEVAECSDRFFLYYSRAPAGTDEQHRLHVAVADEPTGPFEDARVLLPESEGFSIDAHPFRDPRDGAWYLFFARDYFDARTGTGLAVVPLDEGMRAPVGPVQPVLRANADWQIYQRNRTIYGRAWPAWHTVEGPCVVEHDGRYFCFYSGGNWQTHDYGVSYAVADHPLGPWTHAEPAGPLVLRQCAGTVLGPGHNAVVLGPDGRTEWLVYHAWDAAGTARRMFIDRLVWTNNGPRCAGPTTTSQKIE